EAYGQFIRSFGNVTNPVQYRGERFDSILAQYYLRARFYDPATGRFTKQDKPLGNPVNPLSYQRYSYVNSDPVNLVDPRGLMAVAPGAAGMGAMAAVFQLAAYNAIATTALNTLVSALALYNIVLSNFDYSGVVLTVSAGVATHGFQFQP